MASDSLNEVGKYIRGANRKSDLAIKRVRPRLPVRDRARDNVSAVFPFSMTHISEGEGKSVLLDIHFNKPPPDDCSSECFATSCESFTLFRGGHSITLQNPYEAGSITAYSQGDPLELAQWAEEAPNNGQVYVQVQSDVELVIICYSYIIC